MTQLNQMFKMSHTDLKEGLAQLLLCSSILLYSVPFTRASQGQHFVNQLPLDNITENSMS